MKTVLSIFSFAMIVLMGVGAFILFRQGEYRSSALLTGAGFVSISFWIHSVIVQKRIAFQ